MRAIPNPITQLIHTAGDFAGRGTQVFLDFIRDLDIDPVVTLATLPKPTVGRRCFVSDATGGGVPCYADGTDWRRCSDDAIVS